MKTVSFFILIASIFTKHLCNSNSIGLIHQEKALIKSCILFQKFEEAENRS